jgi:transposase
MLHVGIDGHQKSSVVHVFDPVTKEHRARTVPTTAAGLREVLAPLGGDCSVVFEVGTMAQWMMQQIRPLAARVQVANPSRIPWLFRDGRKNDRLDARKLAILGYLDQVPTVHLPPPEVSAWRGLINERRQLVSKRTCAKQQIRALLRANALVCPTKGLWTHRGRIWLKELPLEVILRSRINRLLAEIEFLEAQLRDLERELNTRADAQPAVALLRTIPGIGPRSAEALVAYTDDIQRFSNRKQYASYFGLTPNEDSSGERVRRGRISKRGPSVVRWVMVEAAQSAIRCCPALRAFAQRIARGRKDRWKKAIVATARKLASIAFGMLRSGEMFDIHRLPAA